MIHTVAVFDIDGTLADDALKDVIAADRYYAPRTLRSLPPIPEVVANAQKLSEDDEIEVIAITGRDFEKNRDVTEEWLANHGIEVNDVLLRPSNVPLTQIAATKRQQLKRYLQMNHMPKKGSDFDPNDGLKTVLVWEDTVANLIEFKALLGPTGWDYVLFQVKAKESGHEVKVWDRKVKKVKKPLDPVRNDVEVEVVQMEDVGNMNTFFEDGGSMV